MNTSALLEWSKKLIACPSVTDHGTRAIAELCARELLGPAGITAQLLPSARHGNEQVNLVAAVHGTRADAPPLVLSTHLDTVAAGDPELWTACGGDPFRPSLGRGRIYGLGAADTKLDFAAKALAVVESHKPRRTVLLVGTFGEESGLRGARELADTGLLPAHAPAFIGEPSGLAVVTANRGLNVFNLMVEGQGEPFEGSKVLRQISFVGAAAHSSTPHLGRNAIESALRFLAGHAEFQVLELEGGDAVNKVPAFCRALVAGGSEIRAGETDTPGGATPLPKARAFKGANLFDQTAVATGARVLVERAMEGADIDGRREAMPVEVIHALLSFIERLAQYMAENKSRATGSPSAGLTYNTGVIRGVGPAVKLEFEVRQPPDVSPQEVVGAIEVIVDSLRRDFPKLRFDLTKIRANPGFRATLTDETLALAARAIEQAGLKLRTGEKAGCTEAGVYAGAGLKPVVFGPGPSSGVIHAPNEYNLISEVEAAARFYRALLQM